MTLLQSQEAIGAVTQLLQTRMTSPSINVTIGRPETAAKNGANKINLFLYRIAVDGHLRNHPLDRGQQPPIWLVLHYLMTAFDDANESDSIGAHRLLGKGLSALQNMNFLRPLAQELAGNPDSLKITFDDADVELLSKVMQGSDEKYRISAAFQVRPVMIVPEVQGSYAPLVKTVGPPSTTDPNVGIGVEVLPSLGPQLESITPARFSVSPSITLSLKGSDLSGQVTVNFGPLSISPTGSSAGELTFPNPGTLSAGAYPVTVLRTLQSGHVIGSNPLFAHLLPELTNATPSMTPVPSTSPPLYDGTLTLTGTGLGGPDDSIFVGLYRKGALALMLEAAGVTAQNSLTVAVPQEKALPAGDYLIILRVNGEQADDILTVNWS